MPNMYKIIIVKANAHEVHNTERPTKGSGHGKVIDPRRNSTYKRPFTREGNYLVSIVKAHTFKCQIYPDEVFYVKDLLPTRVTI